MSQNTEKGNGRHDRRRCSVQPGNRSDENGGNDATGTGRFICNRSIRSSSW